MMAPYVDADGLRFAIYRQGLLGKVGKLLGMQDIEVGEPTFDSDFIIKGNNVPQVQVLLANSKIRELIRIQPSITLRNKDWGGKYSLTLPKGVVDLYFSADSYIMETGQLRSIYELFVEMLNHLCRIGSAYGDAPESRGLRWDRYLP
jgi:hypothetical protein